MCTSNTLNTLLNDFPVFYGKKNREDIPNEKNSSHTIDIFGEKKKFFNQRKYSRRLDTIMATG